MLEELHARVIQQSIFTGLTHQTAVLCAQLQKRSQIGSLCMMIWQQMIGLLFTIERGIGFMNSTISDPKGMHILKNKYKGCPIWVAIDYRGQATTFGGWIQTNVSVDYVNAQSFIYSQIVQMDSISAFTNFIGMDGEETTFLKKMVQNDRNMSFWINLAKKWFKAEWMADCNEQL